MNAVIEQEANAGSIAALNAKIDSLAEQVAFLAEEAKLQRRQRQEWDDLKSDLTPAVMRAFQVGVEQLEEVEPYVQLEDLIRLMKRLLRNTHRLEEMLDQLESVAELTHDVAPLTRSAFLSLMELLDDLERRGYFAFIREGSAVVDHVVNSFTLEDINQLGENIVLILQTVKQMTQPQVMHLLQNTFEVVQDEPQENVSWPSLMRQMNDPAVRRGLARTLTVLKSVSDDQPQSTRA